MEKVKEQINTAFAILARIPVSGDSVDLMAAARQALRDAYTALNKATEAAKNDG